MKEVKDFSDSPSEQAIHSRPFWQHDTDWVSCGEAGCGLRFGWRHRKHHCRHCGYIFCNDHVRSKEDIPEMGYTTPQRICATCKEQRASKKRLKENLCLP
eukprot:TRINITY_DN5_c2_g1_i1.p2 TRINITY_DN5_c2_g1~~TRINITY_DN5_c2_g1_i1.p2  ORF type:complete len:115 (+),score=10.54 TRINITY_DN5_c2_g1_i1:46-345(+)